MKNDLPAAAVRLLSSCHVTTVQARAPARSGHINNFRACVIDGCFYDSTQAAAIALRCSRSKIRNMLERGEGRYA